MGNSVDTGTGKRRRPLAVATWTVVTLGIYGLVWYYRINREMRDFGRVRGDASLAGSRPTRSILAVTLGGLIVIPELISLVGTVHRVQRTERLATVGARPAGTPIALFVVGAVLPIASRAHGLASLGLVGLAAYAAALALVQVRLNRAWSAADTAPARAEHSPEAAQAVSMVGSEDAGATVVPVAPAGE
jgi:hypothetical protein